MLEILPICLLHVGILCLVYRSTRSTIFFLVSPITWIIVFDFVFYYLAYLQDNALYRFRFGVYEFFLVQSIAILSAALGQWSAKQRAKRMPEPRVEGRDHAARELDQTRIAIFAPVAISALLVTVILLTVSNWTDYFTRFDIFYAESRRGTSWIYYLMFAMFFYLLYAMYRGRLKQGVGIGLTILSAAVMTMQGGRGLLIGLLLLLLFVVALRAEPQIKTRRPRRRVVLIVATVLVSVGILVGATVLRTGSDWQDYLARFETNDWQLYPDLDFLVQYVDHGGVPWLGSLEDFKYELVPRYFMPTKPGSTFETWIIDPAEAKYGSTRNSGVYGNLYLNLGIWGWIVFLPLFYGSVGALYQKLISGRLHGVSGFLMAAVFGCQELWMKGGLIAARLLTLILSLLLGVFVCEFINLLLPYWNRLTHRLRPPPALKAQLSLPRRHVPARPNL